MNTNWSNEFLKKTVEFWQPRYPYPLSLEDAREIADNMTGLFKFLDTLDRKYDSKNKLIPASSDVKQGCI